MDKIILGILMLRSLTIYEMRKYIDTNFTTICSSSMGSIQAAIKKLLEKNMVTYNEFVENSVNKKVYGITAEGQEFFMNWVKTSMIPGKERNMEFSKLLFMGFVPTNERISLIDAYIKDLEQEKTFLDELHIKAQDLEKEKEKQLDYLEKTGVITDEVSRLREQEKIENIVHFELITIQLGIDKISFEIQWFKQHKDKMKGI